MWRKPTATGGQGVEDRDMKHHSQDYYWENFWRLLSVVAVPFCGFLLLQVMTIRGDISAMETRISVIEANRFSAEDGLAVWRALSDKANKDEVPPSWFKDEFNRLRDDFEKHKIRTRDEELGQ